MKRFSAEMKSQCSKAYLQVSYNLKDVRANLFLGIRTAHADSRATSFTSALSNEMNNDRADGHSGYSFWLDLTVLYDPRPLPFFPVSDFIYNYLHVDEQKINVGR